MPNALRVRRASMRRLEWWFGARTGAWRGAQRGAVGAWWKLSVVWMCATALACGAGGRDTALSAGADSVHLASGGAATAVAAVPAPSAAESASRFPEAVGFRSPRLLGEHFAKHGREFGGITREEYLRQAQALRDAPVAGTVLEVRRDDGVVSRFDRSSGSFLAFDSDGIIRTFFRPNDGEAYFRRQARRRPNP